MGPAPRRRPPRLLRQRQHPGLRSSRSATTSTAAAHVAATLSDSVKTSGVRAAGRAICFKRPLSAKRRQKGAPTRDELDALLHTIMARLMKMLTRRSVLVEDMGQTWLAEPDVDGEEARALRPLQAAAITLQAAPGQWPGPSTGTNNPLDSLCPGSAFSDERVRLNAAGQVAPSAKLRSLVVPQGSEVREQTTEVAAASESEADTVQARPHRISWARPCGCSSAL